MKSNELIAVAPVRPVAGYQGGKKNSAKRLVPIIGRVPHELYVEPFVGMGGIFLRRTARPKREVINDISGDVHNLFLVLREHYAFFLDMLRFQLSSRAEFERLNAMPASSLTDLQRAARFLYLQKTAFGGKVTGRNFGVDPSQPSRFDVTKLASLLEDVHERLAPVTIERLGYAELIAKYDRPSTLFYLDPPYWDCEEDYGPGVFGKGDFLAIAEILRALKGKFMMSINDTSGVREIFAGFDMHELEVTWSIGTKASGAGKRAGELLITNVDRALVLGATND